MQDDEKSVLVEPIDFSLRDIDAFLRCVKSYEGNLGIITSELRAARLRILKRIERIERG